MNYKCLSVSQSVALEAGDGCTLFSGLPSSVLSPWEGQKWEGGPVPKAGGRQSMQQRRFPKSRAGTELGAPAAFPGGWDVGLKLRSSVTAGFPKCELGTACRWAPASPPGLDEGRVGLIFLIS